MGEQLSTASSPPEPPLPPAEGPQPPPRSASAESTAAAAEEAPPLAAEGANSNSSSSSSTRRLPARRPGVYCTVYCVEGELQPGGGGGGEASAEQPSPPASASPPPPSHGGPGENNNSSSSSSNGGLEVVDLYLLPEPFSGLLAADFGPLLVLTCRVCLEEKPLKPLPCCKKPVCEECLKRYLSSQVQVGQADIPCPITECSEHLDETMVLFNLPHDDIIKYKYFLELGRIGSSTKPCPQCKHFTTFRKRGHIPTPTKMENKYKIQCPTCQFTWCFKCHSPWHEGINCKEYKKGDKLLRHWAGEIEHGQRNAQKCPKCKIHIQRTEGCDHMTCSQCNTNFCYRCGERYRQLRFFGDHTSNLSIFGCKYRYLPERPHLRRFVRGSVCGGKLLIAPLILVLGLIMGAIAVIVGFFVLPIYCLCKKKRKRPRTEMPWYE
nr:E3 ubiquitin-protein ligase RNF217 [Anolis sagrei ordinatus]XP_060609261.1 E3 ubiquitin-protein ligase RNF217 [Anolis sagrei ordinatus]